MRSFKALTSAILFALLLASCGGATNPTRDIPDVAGTWIDANAEYVECGQETTYRTEITLEQDGRALTGTETSTVGSTTYPAYDFAGTVTDDGNITGVLSSGDLTFDIDLQIQGDTLTGEFVSTEAFTCSDQPATPGVATINAVRQ